MTMFSNTTVTTTSGSPNFVIGDYTGPNVSQYGWTEQEEGWYVQLLAYVEECRAIKEYLESVLPFIENTEDLANQVKTMYENILIIQSEIEVIYNDFESKYSLFEIEYADFLLKFADFSTKYADFLSKYSDTLAAASSAAASASTSASDAQYYYSLSYDLYLELKQGQVYRGTWNPHTGSYPNPEGTNSVWDVQLNSGETQFTFDGKIWRWGDRVIYLTESSSYSQIQSGSNVSSVNTKTGAVVLNANDVQAASWRSNFASGQGVTRNITGSTVPSSPGIWTANASTWTPVGYGSLLVTTNRSDESTAPGSGTFIHYLFISHSNARLYSATNVNGTFSGWQAVYDSGHKPTANDVDAVARAGDTMTGTLVVNKSGIGVALNAPTGTSSYILGQLNGVQSWYVGRGSTLDDVNLVSYTHNTLFTLKSDRVESNKPFYEGSVRVYSPNNKPTASDVNAVSKTGDTMTGNLTTTKVLVSTPQGSEVNSLTRKDYVDNLVDSSGTKTLTITAPAGVTTGTYYPVVFTNITNRQNLYISTTGGSSSVPMNNCSFSGQVRAFGWGDQGSTVDGMFTIYSLTERAIHSIYRGSESVHYAVYVDGGSFPLEIKVDGGVTVTCTGADIVSGTSTYAVNAIPGTGNIKTIQMVDFNRGQGRYVQSTTSGGAGALYYTTDNKPTAADVGALPITGGILTGKLTVSQTGSTSIAIDSPTGYDSQLQFTRNSTLRFLFNVDAVAETGSNVGSDLNLYGYNDNGTYAGSVFKVRRSTRQLEFQTQPLSIATQSTSQYALTRRDFVEAQDALKVSKSGDTMTGILTFSNLNTGVLFNNASLGNGNGLFAGTGDGASDVKTNVQIKSWYGVGIAPAGTNPDSVNNIWFNARNGDISTNGGLITFGTGAAITLKVPTGASNIVLGQTGSGSTWSNNWYVGRGSGTSDDVQFYSYVHGTNLTLQSDRISFNKPAYTQGYKVLSELDEKVWKNRGQYADLGLASSVLPGYFSFNPSSTGSPDPTSYGHGFSVNPGSNGANGVWSTQFAVTHTGGELFYRNGINGAAQGAWSRVYSTTDKPTSAELNVVSKTGDTMSGLLTLTKTDNAITLNPAASTASFILGQQNNVNNWVIGKTTTNDDIVLGSYIHNTSLSLKTDKISSNKPIMIDVAQSSDVSSLTRKDYVDSGLALQVSKAGDTMSGNLTAPKVLVSSDQGTEVNSLARKDYVDSGLALQVSKSGDTMTGLLTITKDSNAINLNPAASTASYILGQQGGTNNWYVGKPASGSNNISLHSYALTTTITLTSTNVTASRAMSAPDYSVTSDIRLKSNFEKIESPLEKVSKLEGLIYDKKSKFDSDVTREGGLIAQAVKEVMPEAVREDEDGYLSISTSSIIALLLESIKELKKEVDDLKKEELNVST